MIGNANRHSSQAGCDQVGNAWGSGKHQRKRARPKVGDGRKAFSDGRGEWKRDRFTNPFQRSDVHNQRIGRGTAFGFENAPTCVSVPGIRCQAINGLGGHADKLAGLQGFDGLGERFPIWLRHAPLSIHRLMTSEKRRL